MLESVYANFHKRKAGRPSLDVIVMFIRRQLHWVHPSFWCSEVNSKKLLKLLPFGYFSMELPQCLLPSLSLLRLDGYEMTVSDYHLILNLTSTQTKAACSIYGQHPQLDYSEVQN